jgi:hypothetical protein
MDYLLVFSHVRIEHIHELAVVPCIASKEQKIALGGPRTRHDRRGVGSLQRELYEACDCSSGRYLYSETRPISSVSHGCTNRLGGRTSNSQVDSNASEFLYTQQGRSEKRRSLSNVDATFPRRWISVFQSIEGGIPRDGYNKFLH